MRKPEEVLNELLCGVNAVAPNTGELARELRDGINDLRQQLGLLTPICVPTTGEAPRRQRQLEHIECFPGGGGESRLYVYLTGRRVGAEFFTGQTQDHLIQTFADLCIEIAKK